MFGSPGKGNAMEPIGSLHGLGVGTKTRRLRGYDYPWFRPLYLGSVEVLKLRQRPRAMHSSG